MFKVVVEGEYYRKMEDGKKPPAPFKEEFHISESFEEHAMLRICRRMLVKERLKTSTPDFHEVKTCGLWEVKKTKARAKGLKKDELFELSRSELLEHAAKVGVFIKGSKLGRPRDIIQDVLKAQEFGGERLKQNHDERVVGTESAKEVAKPMLPGELVDNTKEEFGALV